MAGYDGSIRINTELNTGDFQRSLKGLVGSVKGLLGTLGVGLSIAGLVALSKQAIETASDIQEVQDVVDTAFGDMAYKMEQFASTSVKQFGISKLSAKEMGSTFMAMGASMVDSMEEASDMAIALTARSADMASFYNKSAQETATALKSIYTGETETLKAYGVVMTEINLQEYAATKGITKKISAMTQAEKVQLRYNYVMEQTALAAGDFAKTSDSWANQTRILSEQFKELLSVIGSGLITVLTPVVKFLNTVLTQLIVIAKQIGAILSKLFGISIPVADSGKFADNLSTAAGGADELTEGIEEAGKAAKNAVAPFDDLQVLAKDSGSGGASSEAGISGGFEMPELELEGTEVEEMSSAIDGLIERLKPLFDWFKKLKDLFVEGFFDGLGESWKDRIADIEESARNIIKTLTEIFTAPSVVAAAQTMIEKTVYAMGQALGAVTSIGITIGQNLVGGIDMYLTDNKDFLKEKLISIFDIAGDIASLIGEAFASIAYIFEAFGSENGQQLTANIIGIFVDTFVNVKEIILKLVRDILNIFIQPFIDNKEGFRTALEGFLGVLADVAGTIKQGIDDTFSKLNEVYDAHFKPFFDSVAQGLSGLVGSFLEFWNGSVQPILDSWAEKIDEVWQEHIQPMINNFIELLGQAADFLKEIWENIIMPFIQWLIDNILPVILPIFDGIVEGIIIAIGFIGDSISGVIDIFSGLITFLSGVFTGNWKKAWDGIAEIVNGVKNNIKGIVNAIIGFVESMVNGFIRGLNEMIDTLKNLTSIKNPITGNTVWELNISKLPEINLPRLATGAVIRGGNPFMAILGDQPAGHTNIEAPADLIREMARQGIREELSSMNLGGRSASQVISLNVNGEEFARLTLENFLQEMDRQGYDVQVLGVN